MEKEDMEKIVNMEKIEKSNYYVEEKTRLKKFKLLKIGIIALVLFLAFKQLMSSKYFFYFLEKFFFNEQMEFQWVGITSVIAIITLTVNTFLTIKKNRADLVAKSRIEWLQSVKTLISEYVNDLSYYSYLFIFKDGNNVSNNELNHLAKNIEKTKYLLLLNFSDNKDNEQINKCIIDCYLWIETMPSMKKSGYEKDVLGKNIHVDNLVLVSRDYLKREWERAKSGK